MGKIQKIALIERGRNGEAKDTCENGFCIASLLVMKRGFFLKISSKKKYGSAQAYHLHRKTESLCQENDALCLMGVEGVDPL